MRRVIAQPSITAPQRVELWRVARATGAARRLTQDAAVSIVSWADCVDRSRVNCLADTDSAVLALVHKQGKSEDSANSLAYARIAERFSSIDFMPSSA